MALVSDDLALLDRDARSLLDEVVALGREADAAAVRPTGIPRDARTCSTPIRPPTCSPPARSWSANPSTAPPTYKASWPNNHHL